MSRSRLAVLLFVLMALVMSTAEVPERAVATAAPENPKPAVVPVESRPDVVSAALSARAQGSRVEVESLRTESSTTWSNPDGTMTTEAHAAPVRFKDSAGGWRGIDLTWRRNQDGTIGPAGHPLGLRLGKAAGKSGSVFASAASDSNKGVEWVAPWALPEPTLSGTMATYADIEPGIDLVVHTRRSGFEFDFVVKRRPATAPVWRIPLRVKGLTVKPQPDGSIHFVDGKGQLHSTIPVPYMWDAAVHERSGEPVNRFPVKITVENNATLLVAPDRAWFMDPKRVYPITVDPTYATQKANPSFDTWVQSDYTSDQSTSTELKLGTYNDGAVKARSFLNMPVAPFKGKQILSASLYLYETWSYSCTPSAFAVRSATPASTATRWTSQPTIGGSYGSKAWAKGHDANCADGWVFVPITGLVQAWSGASYSTGGMALVATDESDSNSWKRFRSTETSSDPYILYTYNRPPGTHQLGLRRRLPVPTRSRRQTLVQHRRAELKTGPENPFECVWLLGIGALKAAIAYPDFVRAAFGLGVHRAITIVIGAHDDAGGRHGDVDGWPAYAKSGFGYGKRDTPGQGRDPGRVPPSRSCVTRLRSDSDG